MLLLRRGLLLLRRLLELRKACKKNRTFRRFFATSPRFVQCEGQMTQII